MLREHHTHSNITVSVANKASITACTYKKAVHVSGAGGKGEKNALCVSAWLLAGFLFFFMAEKVRR